MAKAKDDNFFELIRGGSISLFLKVIGMVIGYAVMLFITNKFGAEGYGEYVLSLTILGVVLVFSKFGIDISIVRIIAEIKSTATKKDILNVLKRIFIISLVIGLLVTVLFIGFSDRVVEYISDDTSFKWNLNQIAYLILPATLVFVIAGYFQAYKKTFFYILFNSFLINFFLLGSLLFFEVIDDKRNPFVLYKIAVYITFLLAIVLLIIDIFKRTYEKDLPDLNKFKIPEIINISFPMLLAGSFVLFINWSDILMLSYFSEEKDIGIYNASQKLADISSITLFAINAIATPKFAELFSKRDMKGLENTVVKSTKLILFLSIPILAVLVLFPKTILSINGSEFVAGYMALIFLCIGKFFNSISGSVGYILQMTNNQNIFRNVMVFAALLNVILNYILIPKYNYNGAALASMITVITWNIILVYIIKRKLGFWTLYNPIQDLKKLGKK